MPRVKSYRYLSLILADSKPTHFFCLMLEALVSYLATTPINMLLAAGSGQPQAQRFNQPISFVSSGTVGSDPMEIRPALQQVPLVASSPVAAGAVMKFVTPLAVSPIAPAQDAARHWSASDAQLPQAAEPMQAPVSSQAHTPGETCFLLSVCASLL